MTPATLLATLDACEEAQVWAKTQPDRQTAWTACKRSDWMLWMLNKTSVDENDPRLRLIACDFAEAVLHLVPEGEDRPRKAIEVSRRFAIGEATEEDLIVAQNDAWDAAWDAPWTAGEDSWHDAWDAAWAAGDAAGVAAGVDTWNDTRVARVTAWAVGDAQSDIIRKYFPECPEIDAKYLGANA